MAKERTWTDDDLRTAVASSKTMVEVLKKLKLSQRGRNHVRVSRRIIELGLEKPSARRHDIDAALREAVPQCTTYEDVLRRVGLPATTENLNYVNRRISVLGLGTTHFVRTHIDFPRRARWTDDDLRAAVAASGSVAQTLRALRLIPAGGNYVRVKRKIRELGIDTSHFTGMAWNRGGTFRPNPPRPLEELLVKDRWTSTNNLKERLFRAGLKTPACELCAWAACAPDGRVPVEIDHINGDNSDNRIENLRILCPNCHALQPTHRGLNQKRRKR